eukprot:10592949-Ditylum_brightwellii.AAC.1
MFQCKHNTACRAQLHMIGKLRSGLKKMKTNGTAQKVFLFKIQQWCGVKTTLPRIPCDELGDLLSAAVEDQHELGWDNLVKGRIYKNWGLAQEAHFDTFYLNLIQNMIPQEGKDLIILL